jgi:hypothetical protein
MSAQNRVILVEVTNQENADFALPRVIQTVLSVQRSQTDKTVCITSPDARLQAVLT